MKMTLLIVMMKCCSLMTSLVINYTATGILMWCTDLDWIFMEKKNRHIY